ncbi:MAG TPA: cupin domain-containing protein [Aldersonia sp.]
MEIRRVVTGVDGRGKSVFLSDGPAPHSHDCAALPGQAQTCIWYTAAVPTTVPPEGEPTTARGRVVAPPGGDSFVIVRFAPDSLTTTEDFDGQRLHAEFGEFASDIAASSDPDNPGMHRTQSLDYGVILDGEVWLELDDGAQTRLTRSDTIVQIAARHAWHNKSDAPATAAFLLTGAEA